MLLPVNRKLGPESWDSMPQSYPVERGILLLDSVSLEMNPGDLSLIPPLRILMGTLSRG